MASRRAIERAARRAAMRDADVQALADKLFRAKRRVYRRTLLQLAESLGYSITRPQLSDALEAELRAAAERNARFAAKTHNRDLARFAAGLTDRRDDELDAAIKTWRISRSRARARPTAITEAYEAHADALVSAATAIVGDDAEWDFGGHPDDADPACAICVTLVNGSPWTTAEVIEIGTPHVQCRQDWHLRGTFSPQQLPDTISLGESAAGIVGRPPLIARAGGREQAVSALVDLRSR